jgi:hypothetical protein
VLRKCCERSCSQHPTSGVFLLSSPHVATILRSCCEKCIDVANNFCDVAKSFSHVANIFPMLRTVTLRNIQNCVRNIEPSLHNIQIKHSQHQKSIQGNIASHVATHVACNIQTSGPSSLPSRHNTQHHVSATSKVNIHNIENQCLRHKKLLIINCR